MAAVGLAQSETGPTLEEILSRHGFKEEELARECPRNVTYDIAVELGADWEMIGVFLEFTLDELRGINRENSSQEICRVSLLDTWHKIKGEGATFLKLARALHRGKRRDLVDLLCRKLKSTMTLVPLSGNVTHLEMPSGNDQQLGQHFQSGSSSSVIHLDVSNWIKTLEEQFYCIHDHLVNELSSGGTSVDQVLQVLMNLPFTFRKEYESTIQNMLPELEKKEVVRNLFYRLYPLFTFIDYELLQHLVSKLGSQMLKQEMTSYTENVKFFKKITTIGELTGCWPGLEVPQIDHKVLRVKLAGDPKSFTLEKLDYFRNRFYNKLRCSEFVAVTILMLLESTNSFIAVLFIPTVSVQEITKAIRLGLSTTRSVFFRKNYHTGVPMP